MEEMRLIFDGVKSALGMMAWECTVSIFNWVKLNDFPNQLSAIVHHLLQRGRTLRTKVEATRVVFR